MKGLTQAQLSELEELRADASGELRPEAIVEFARSSNTALHSAFTWDDGVAAEKYRLHQARSVIRAAVTLLPRPDGGMVAARAYVFDARAARYAATVEVMANPESAEVLLRQMRLDVERAISRYRRYAALAPHIAAVLAPLKADA